MKIHSLNVSGFTVTSLLIFLIDSLYYGELTFLKLWNLSMDWDDWKFTPLNFVMYNTVPGNLDKHGGNSQKFLRKICNIFLTFRCFYEAVIHRKNIIYDFSSS